MRVLPRLLPALILVVCAAPAQAARLTIGSNLKPSASVTSANGADTAFWPISVGGKAFRIPEDAQVLSAKVKGTVHSEQGAAPPANMIHFQSLEPAKSGGERQIYLTSQAFYLPIDSPDAVTTYNPENLCVHKGGSVAFNDIGGFMWGGSLTAPLDPDHYLDGAPFQIFGAVRKSSTARFTSDESTNNGDMVTSATANQQPGAPVGTVMKGRELLMQIVLATGQDRSQACGGPRRHPDGSLVVAAPAMHVITPQRAYVKNDRRFAPAFYCAGPKACSGIAKLELAGRTIATGTLTAAAATSA
ncbi:MAG: hypothetical protein JWM71_2474, partial [Solirubrobacteraceae bacterium]|nr:hypothetical protein [Solirubrobacteraceae bacterium]